jgi:peroxiredoxin
VFAWGLGVVLGWATQAKEPVSNFMLLDSSGRAHELRRQAGQAVVVFFTANGCPIARQNIPKLKAVQDNYRARGVTVWLINSNSGDDRSSIQKEQGELNARFLPVLKDDTQGVARHFKVHRTCETFVIRTSDWTVAYQGAVDDQFAEGAGKPESSENYLIDALESVLAGKPVAKPFTSTRGCRIHFDVLGDRDETRVSYVKDVFPILESKCVSCHSPGNIGSWSMDHYRRVRGMSSMIEEVLLTRRMPPWDPDPEVGKFANDSSLTIKEVQTLLLWVEQGAAWNEADGPDPLSSMKMPEFVEWPLGQPDIIMRLPKPEVIPPTGVLDYRHIEVLANNETPAYVGAVYVKPGNRRVVHHVIGRLKSDDLEDPSGRGEVYLGWASGTTQEWYPNGTGKYLPPHARFDLEMHYSTCGSEQTDETEVGLYLLKDKPKDRFESVPIFNSQFEILPQDPNSQALAIYGFDRSATLYGVTPHMHLRGKWMLFELLFPDGSRKQVCSVPRYDSNWQQTYMLEKPLKIPAGTWGLLRGGFDNSPQNPSNPNPNISVGWGEQTWDEMFLGWFKVAWNDSSGIEETMLREQGQKQR